MTIANINHKKKKKLNTIKLLLVPIATQLLSIARIVFKGFALSQSYTMLIELKSGVLIA